jgi:hypothetical protein
MYEPVVHFKLMVNSILKQLKVFEIMKLNCMHFILKMVKMMVVNYLPMKNNYLFNLTAKQLVQKRMSLINLVR